MMDKVCSKCSFVGDSSLFRKERNVCLVCLRKQKKEYQRGRRKIAGHLHRAIERKSEAKNAHKKRSKTQKDRDALSDSYVKSVIANQAGVLAKDVPIELIEVKRQHILINRLLRSSKHG